MTWRGPATPRDELLGTYTWRVRKLNPRALVVGHVTPRYYAKRAGWTEAQINSIANTRPECVQCSNRSGQQLGARVKNNRQQRRRDDHDRW
jgi:hypothetical protein